MTARGAFVRWRFMPALLCAIFVRAALFGETSPFGVDVTRTSLDGTGALSAKFTVPADHLLYADQISVSLNGETVTPARIPDPVRRMDVFSGEEKAIYDRDFEIVYVLPGAGGGDVTVEVNLQGCDATTCFFPETRRFTLAAGGEAAGVAAPPPSDGDGGPPAAAAPTVAQLDHFDVVARKGGYLGAADFLAFLGGETASATVPRGWLLTLLFTLLGGLALNLTPCVLPMIPVNLAIIGAGVKAGSKRRGFLLGAAYGLGIALAYGALGLVVVLTKSTFGALNANPWFNASMAALFVFMAVAMSGLVPIDFSRFQAGAAGGIRSAGSGAALAVAMGAIAALLAGACVAPALISVLLLAGSLHAQGNPVGLALPFILGLGMALPWPFAGAGLAFLPKPGGWMNAVKYAFAVLILGMGVYYGWLAWGLFRPAAYDPAAQERALAAALQKAESENKAVFIDFWATWCRNCHAMDKTTFQNPDVQLRLRDFVVVKYQAERPDRDPARGTLARFQALGLPTYVVLKPKRPPSFPGQ